MDQIRTRLTYANVMSSIAVFLVLGGATALAASHLGKNSVGTKQLKKNSVSAAKIKKGAVNGAKLADGAVTESKLGDGSVTESKVANSAVTGAKIANGAVTGDKVADGSLSGTDINPGSTPFSQITARLRNPGPVNMQSGGATFLGTYTQAANEDDIFFSGLDVTFAATCAPPRSAQVLLLLNNASPTIENIIGQSVFSDSVGGALTKRIEVTEFFGFSSGGMRRMAQPFPQNQTFFLYTTASCNSGSGVTGSNLGLDVLGTK